MNDAATNPFKGALRISFFNGWSITLFSGCIAVVSLLMLSPGGIVMGLVITAAGFMEVKGHGLMKGGKPASIRWLCGSQIFLFSVLILYCLINLFMFHPESALESLPPDALSMVLALGFDESSLRVLIAQAFYLTYIAVIIVTVVYQGGLCLYYLSKGKHFAEQGVSPGNRPD